MAWNQQSGYGFRYGGEGAKGAGGGGLRGWLADRFGGNGSPAMEKKDGLPVIGMELPPASWSDRNAKTFILEGYKKNSAVFAVTKALANAFAEAPLFCYEDETKKKALPAHPLRVRIKRPNPIMGEDEWWKYIVTYAVTTGNGYGHMVESEGRGGPPAEIWPYSDVLMWAVPGGGTWIREYLYSLWAAGGVMQVPIPVERVAHWKWAVDPEFPYKGMGALLPVAREVDTDNELTRFMKALLQNDAMPRSIIRIGDKPVTPRPHARNQGRVERALWWGECWRYSRTRKRHDS
jgi:phage portal protein BeeE